MLKKVAMSFENKTPVGRFLELNVAFWLPDKDNKVPKEVLDVVHDVDEWIVDLCDVPELGTSLVYPSIWA